MNLRDIGPILLIVLASVVAVALMSLGLWLFHPSGKLDSYNEPIAPEKCLIIQYASDGSVIHYWELEGAIVCERYSINRLEIEFPLGSTVSISGKVVGVYPKSRLSVTGPYLYVENPPDWLREDLMKSKDDVKVIRKETL